MIAIDSNVILYAFEITESSNKKQTALELIQNNSCFSSQVLSEVINVFTRRWKFNKEKVIGISSFLINNCSLNPISKSDVLTAHQLINRYDFQYFDALIVASALNNNCTILYSEDMQHNMVIDGKLIIINPFI